MFTQHFPRKEVAWLNFYLGKKEIIYFKCQKDDVKRIWNWLNISPKTAVKLANVSLSFDNI